MNTSMHTTEVRDYVAQVRAALSDLPVEDVEEFTTGMEADLSERLAEPGEGTLRDRLGTPEAYAAELRAAAGLPPRVAVAATKQPAAERLSQWWDGVAESVLGALPWLRDLRPLWWGVRGVALAAIPAIILGVPIIWLAVLGVLVSVVAGLMARRGKLRGGGVRPLRFVLNAVAVMALPFAFILLVDGAGRGSEPIYEEPAMYGPTSLAHNGENIANLYAYDETGRRIDNVRLFDQNGRAIKLDPEAIDLGPDSEGARDPNTGEPVADMGVFPLSWPGHQPWSTWYDWKPPLAITPLPGPVPSVEPSPTTSTPSAGTASPTSSATPSGSAPRGATPSPSATSPGSGAAATPSPSPSASR